MSRHLPFSIVVATSVAFATGCGDPEQPPPSGTEDATDVALGVVDTAAPDVALPDDAGPVEPPPRTNLAFKEVWRTPGLDYAGSGVTFVDENQFVAATTNLADPDPFTYKDGIFALWGANGRHIRDIASIQGVALGVAISPDRKSVAWSNTRATTLKIAPVAGGEPKSYTLHDRVDSSAFAPDGRSIFVGTHESTGYYDPKFWRIYFDENIPYASSTRYDGYFSVLSLVVSDDAESITAILEAHGESNLALTLRASDLSERSRSSTSLIGMKADARTGNPLQFGLVAVGGVALPTGEIADAAPHPTLPKAIAIQTNGTVYLVDLVARKVEASARVCDNGRSVDVSPDGIRVVVGCDNPGLVGLDLVPAEDAEPGFSEPSLCPNGWRSPLEYCDGSGTFDCASIGRSGGEALRCTDDCKLDAAGCGAFTAGWSCEPGRRGDGRCDCGCDAPDPDCGILPTAAMCDRSACRNGTVPKLDDPTRCVPNTCDNIGPWGRCNGDKLEYCVRGQIVGQSCGTCVSRQGAPTCKAGFGSCVMDFGLGGLVYRECDGPGGACKYQGKGEYRCVKGAPTCGLRDKRCLPGDLLKVDCNVNQPVLFDCLAFGGRCQEGVCIGALRGAECNEHVICGGGLACRAGKCQ